jgi:hypothetical protein
VPPAENDTLFPAANLLHKGESMIIKRGNVVSHTGVNTWGAGKVIEVAAFNATIQFSDGVTRKIASSHFDILAPADPASFIPTEVCEPVAKKVVPRVRKKKVPPADIEEC